MIATFYLPILECVRETGTSGISSEGLRRQMITKLGNQLSESERSRLVSPSRQRTKGNYFEWALADLVTYKCLSKHDDRYLLTEEGNHLLSYIARNPGTRLSRGFLRQPVGLRG